MADSRRQSAVEALKTFLTGITTGNGYETSLGNHVFVWKGGPWQASELPGVSIEDPEDNIEAGSMGLNQEDHKLLVEVKVAVGQADEIDKLVRKCIADIYKKIGTDRKLGTDFIRVTWPRGDKMGLVQDGDARGGAVIKLEVNYRTGLLNPYA